MPDDFAPRRLKQISAGAEYAADPKIVDDRGFSTTYIDIKTQKSRSIAQLHLLTHPETSAQIVRAIGLPVPANPHFFALCKLTDNNPLADWPVDMTYADITFQRSAGNAILKFEMPIEHADELFEVFGTPNAAAPLIIFATPLRHLTNAERHDRWRRQKFVREAGQLACMGDFQLYVGTIYGQASMDAAASFIRSHCNVISRKDLFHDVSAQKRFTELVADFRTWLKRQEAK